MAQIQRSFSGGILSPTLFGRADQQKYLTGLRTCRNFIPTASGAAVNRAGFEFISEIVDSTVGARLIPFIFNDAQTYVLEFGAGYIRFIQSGVLLAPEGVVSFDPAAIYGLAALVTDGVATYYSKIAGNIGHTPSISPTQWVALLQPDIYNIVTPYTADEIADVRYIQSADVMTLFHPNHAPQELSRLGETTWTLAAVTTVASITAPTGLGAVAGVTPATSPVAPAFSSVTGGTAGADPDRYKVTAFDATGPDYSEGPASALGFHLTNQADNVNPIVLVWGAVAGADGYAIYKQTDPTVPSSPYALIGVTTALTWTDDGQLPAIPVKLLPLNATTAKTYSYKVTAVSQADGTESDASSASSCSGQSPSSVHPNVVSWIAVAGARAYNVYRADASGVYGYVGSATDVHFYDPPTDASATDAITQDNTHQPPVNRALFASASDYPSVGTYFQQRLCAASSLNDPEKVWLSRVGSFHDFTQATPIADDDPVIFTAAGERANTIRQMATINGKLILGTQDGIWSVDGDQSGVVTPTSINLRQQIYGGCNGLRLLPIENTALYVQARGSVVRDLVYSWQSNGYTGHDLTIFAPHLFATFTLVDWAYQQIPYSLVWAVRDDGALLSLTYNHEQEVWGWAEHDTAGDAFEAVCCVPEGTEDALYAIVARTIGGVVKRYIERGHTRVVEDVTTDAFFVDCGLTFDGRNDGATTVAITGGTLWTYTESLTLEASAAQFTAGDVGKAYRLTIGGVACTVVVSTVIDPTHATGHATTDVPVAFRGVPTTAWALAVHVVFGLGHLEGRTVSVLVDGAAQRDLVVTGGSVTVPGYGSVIHAGLPITAELGSLDWEDPTHGTQVDKVKRINRVSMLVDRSRGFEVGQDAATATPYKQQIDQRPGDPSYLLSANVDIAINAKWNTGGRVYLRQQDPLPCAVLAVAITGLLGT